MPNPYDPKKRKQKYLPDPNTISLINTPTDLNNPPVDPSSLTPPASYNDPASYEEAIDELKAGDKKQQPQQNPSTYDYLRNASAKDLLDAQVATELNNAVARKNLSTDLARMGLGNSGYAGVADSIIANQRSAEIAQAQANYNDAINDINSEEAQANQKLGADRALLVTDYLGALSPDSGLGQSDIDRRIGSYGLVWDGKQWVNGDGVSYTADQLREINNAYEDAMRELGSSRIEGADGGVTYSGSYGTKDDLKNALNSVRSNLGNDLDWEIGYIYDNLDKYAEGDVVSIVNGSDDSKSVYVKKVGNKWVVATEEEYKKQDKQNVVKNGKPFQQKKMTIDEFKEELKNRLGSRAPTNEDEIKKAYEKYLAGKATPW